MARGSCAEGGWRPRGSRKGWAKQAGKLAEAIGASPATGAAEALALARPDFVARRRDVSGEHWLSAGGRGYVLDPASPLARAEWIVIGDAQGQAKGARITAGAEIAADRIPILFAKELEERVTTRWNSEKGRVEARRERRLGAIVLGSVPEPSPDPSLLVDILVEKALENLGEVLPQGFLARAGFCRYRCAFARGSARPRGGMACPAAGRAPRPRSRAPPLCRSRAGSARLEPAAGVRARRAYPFHFARR